MYWLEFFSTKPKVMLPVVIFYSISTSSSEKKTEPLSLCHERRLYVKEISKLERIKHDKFNALASLSEGEYIFAGRKSLK